MIEPNHDELSVREQCMLLGLNRSTLYYAPREIDKESDTLMRRIDELHTAHITWGSRKIRDALRLEGWAVNWKRVQRLMRLMRLCVVFPQSHHDRLPPDHEVYPYLLRGVSVERALNRDGAPEIFNSDHAGRSLRELLAHASRGVQFTSPKFLDPLKETTASISMDGKGRALDNVIIERFRRTLKYDEVYLNDYASPAEARERIGDYIAVYNCRRPHDALSGKTPNMAYVIGASVVSATGLVRGGAGAN